MIILNEKKYIEDILSGDRVVDNMYYTLGLLARYYYQQDKENNKPAKLYKILVEFLKSKNESEFDWQHNLDKLIKKRDIELVNVEYIPMTKIELDTIKEIKNKRLEKLAFTLLCVAKLNNTIQSTNNNWVNRDVKEIFKLANVRDGVIQQYLSMADLKDLGLLKYSKKVNNINLCITFIDNESKIELEINDFRDLGFQYLAYLGEGFIKCECCKKVVPIKSKKDNSTKYCEECSKEKQRESWRLSKQKSRNVHKADN